MFRARNVIEAGILAFAIGVPVFMFVPFGLTTRIIILCLTALPAALVALIGISGESLSEFLIIFLKYLRNRRIVGGDGQQSNEQAPPMKRPGRHLKQRAPKEKESRPPKRRRSGESDFPAEFDEVRSYEIREKLRPKKKPKKELSSKKAKKKPNKRKEKACPPKRPAHIKEQPPACLNPVADYLPIEKIQNGIIYTKDHRYVKVVEVVPINFMLRSAREQRNIIYSFVSYLKISPVKLQIKVLTRRADINRHLDTVRREMAQEKNEQCRLMQEDYLSFVQQIGAREAVTRRFFLIFEYEPWNNTRRSEQEEEAIQSLQSAVHTASNYLRQCGNEVIIPENEDEFTVDVLYNLLCRNESVIKPLALRAQEVVAQYAAKGRESEIDHIPAAEFAAPKSIDFTHGSYLCIDGLYYAYLLIPSDGYKTQVPAGWLSLIVNAGDGIDMDMFLSRQPKERIIQRVGQQLRINRSKIKDASDTNTDFDDIDGAIRSGYFLKEGLSNNEDFYYLNLLITVTAPTEEDLEWKVSEMKKLLLSQDMDVRSCHFREEQAFLSALPLVSMEKGLFERGKRNLLTGGAASCYPFTSFEMCDDNGILLGVNKYNSSLIIVDIFNSAIYKNANISILGTSGAGKTFTMQLMALRMRRKNIPIFIVAPLKGHEFHRACANVGGEFIQISPASPHCINVKLLKKGFAINSLESINNLVHPALELAVDDDYIRKNPSKGVYRSLKSEGSGKPAKTRIALTKEQQKNFLRFISKSPMYSHWLPVMVVLLGTGLRVGECTGLTKNDVDLENNTISVNHNLIYRVIDGKAGFHITTPKTASGTRTIPILYPEVAEQLRALIEVMDALYPEDLVMNGYHGFLFRNRSGYFLSAHNINRAIERISIAYNAEEMDQAELEDREPSLLPHFSVHNLRHTFCTRLCESTNDIKFIQQVMGHADFSTTMDIYTHITQENMKEKAEVIKGNLVLM